MRVKKVKSRIYQFGIHGMMKYTEFAKNTGWKNGSETGV